MGTRLRREQQHRSHAQVKSALGLERTVLGFTKKNNTAEAAQRVSRVPTASLHSRNMSCWHKYPRLVCTCLEELSQREAQPEGSVANAVEMMPFFMQFHWQNA